MLSQARYAQIDNYLDLYRFAGKLNDTEWQDEILGRLAELQQDHSDLEFQKERNLQQQFVEVNRQILTLYQRLRCHTLEATDEVTNKLFALKQRRLELGREIDELKHGHQQFCQ
ncbi:hypothetical protein E4665_17290 [Sporolactobacillus shoreae]|uniref:Uncharacterized protein n=1 Tax=Sporolactobacillus shoreae TaxID=1465501 RepID=A0A4Z0GJT4_9BACL|nr:hypothetical protein [Sporolactobacillus shoreae]TGA95866.1 hypothetical protein E4665_17290 [Sporolactobacillus shoreae]